MTLIVSHGEVIKAAIYRLVNTSRMLILSIRLQLLLGGGELWALIVTIGQVFKLALERVVAVGSHLRAAREAPFGLR